METRESGVLNQNVICDESQVQLQLATFNLDIVQTPCQKEEIHNGAELDRLFRGQSKTDGRAHLKSHSSISFLSFLFFSATIYFVPNIIDTVLPARTVP